MKLFRKKGSSVADQKNVEVPNVGVPAENSQAIASSSTLSKNRLSKKKTIIIIIAVAIFIASIITGIFVWSQRKKQDTSPAIPKGGNVSKTAERELTQEEKSKTDAVTEFTLGVDAGKKKFDELIEQKGTDAEKAQLYIEKAIACKNSGDYKCALESYTKAYELSGGTDAMSLREIIRTAIALKEKDVAMQYLQIFRQKTAEISEPTFKAKWEADLKQLEYEVSTI